MARREEACVHTICVSPQYVHIQVFQVYIVVACCRVMLSLPVCFYLFYFMFSFECAPLQILSLTSFHELLALKWKLITQEYSLKGCLEYMKWSFWHNVSPLRSRVDIKKKNLKMWLQNKTSWLSKVRSQCGIQT